MNTVYFLVQQTMFFSIPLLIVALGGMFSERSGVVNIALEGIMIMGAFSSILFINIVQSSGAALPPQLLLLLAVLIAAAVGVLVAMRAPISGAIGGCQSEIGVASAMTAAGLAQLGGGTPEQVIHAAAIALKNLLGLICDPVAGPVEIPCIKRNAVGVSNAFAAADMALAGIASRIPPDEVVDALINVQGLLHPDLRGNLRGGLASTATGRALKDEWYARMKRMQA